VEVVAQRHGTVLLPLILDDREDKEKIRGSGPDITIQIVVISRLGSFAPFAILFSDAASNVTAFAYDACRLRRNPGRATPGNGCSNSSLSGWQNVA
jgi:hypothetical protein